MIAFVRGVVEARDGLGVVVAVGGVGLRVLTSTATLSQVGGIGETALLHTLLYVREDVLALYGFATPEERELFELLITVNGVGPRLGLAILSALSVDQLRGAIGRGSADLLTVVPGIGKRLASRIVLDLREKVAGRGTTVADVGPIASGDAEVIEALTQVFGYSAQQAAQAVSALGAGAPTDLEERIRLALQYFSQAR